MGIIAERGVAAATFEAIGREAGYSRGLATQHFGSKQRLIDEVVTYLHDQQESHLRAAHIDDLNGLDVLLAYVSAFCAALKRSDEPKSYFMLLSDAVANAHETRAVFARAHERIKSRLVKWIRQGQAEGLIRRDVDPGAMAVSVGSLLMGLGIQSLIDPDVRIATVEKSITAALRRGLCVRERRAPRD